MHTCGGDVLLGAHTWTETQVSCEEAGHHHIGPHSPHLFSVPWILAFSPASYALLSPWNPALPCKQNVGLPMPSLSAPTWPLLTPCFLMLFWSHLAKATFKAPTSSVTSSATQRDLRVLECWD